MSIEALIGRLIKREGGYVNHPSDRGGPTNRGITRGTLSTHRGAICNAMDVRNMPRSEAVDIYRKNYFQDPKIDQLPECLQEHVFDCAVLSGPVQGVKHLQQALIVLGSEIDVDGKIGPETIRACGAHPVEYINNVLVYIRLLFFDELVRNKPSQKVFFRGWTTRAKKFRIYIGTKEV